MHTIRLRSVGVLKIFAFLSVREDLCAESETVHLVASCTCASDLNLVVFTMLPVKPPSERPRLSVC